MSEHKCALRCWTCGKSIDIVTSDSPKFAFDLVQWALDIGWVGVFDMAHRRSLVFCSDGCCENAKTKRGTFRVHPPKQES